MSGNALIFGAGAGISASFARALAKAKYRVGLVARDTGKLTELVTETGARTYTADVTSQDEVKSAFADFEKEIGAPNVVLYNPSARSRGSFVELKAEDVRRAIEISAFGGFLVAQAAAKSMLAKEGGTILLTGASASVKGYAKSAPFAMGKFALRGMAQSMARELHPKGIHVCHIVVDGGVRSADRSDDEENPDAWLNPDAIAETYMHLVNQDRSAWSWEIELRPWVENF